MGRTHTQHVEQSLRLRIVAAFLLVLFGLQAAPLALAQVLKAPDCCMARDGQGCSMHLHRAEQAQQTRYTFAALQPRCPCTPLVPTSVDAHDSQSLSASHLHFVLAAERAASVQPRNLCGVQTTGNGCTRGPPSAMLLA